LKYHDFQIIALTQDKRQQLSLKFHRKLQPFTKEILFTLCPGSEIFKQETFFLPILTNFREENFFYEKARRKATLLVLSINAQRLVSL